MPHITFDAPATSIVARTFLIRSRHSFWQGSSNGKEVVFLLFGVCSVAQSPSTKHFHSCLASRTRVTSILLEYGYGYSRIWRFIETRYLSFGILSRNGSARRRPVQCSPWQTVRSLMQTQLDEPVEGLDCDRQADGSD
jgi:hypothetical protein